MKVGAGGAAKLQDLQLGIDEHSGRRELIDSDAVGFSLGGDLGAERFDGPAPRGLDPRGLRRQRFARRGFATRLPGRQLKGGRWRRLLAVDLVLLVYRLEEIGEATDGFRRSEIEESPGLERVMKHREQLLLQARLEIDEQVAAAKQVHAREGWIAGEVLPGEDHHLAQGLVNPIAPLLLDEESPQPAGWRELDGVRQQIPDDLLQSWRIAQHRRRGPVEIPDEAQFLRGNTKELDALYSDALISVTSFFRNPDAFDVLERKVLPTLLQRHGDEPLRVWVLGCSTGQEAYSIAMAFVEAAEKAPRMRKPQVFATDLNDALLDKARHGLYAKSVAQDLSPEPGDSHAGGAAKW